MQVSLSPRARSRPRAPLTHPGFTVQQGLWGFALLVVLGLTAAWRLATWRANADEMEMRGLVHNFATLAEMWNEKHGQYPATVSTMPDLRWPDRIDPFFYRVDGGSWAIAVRHPQAGRLCAYLAPVGGGGTAQATCGEDLTATVEVSATRIAPGTAVTLDATSALRTLWRQDPHPVALIGWKVGAAPWDIGPVATHTIRAYTLPEAETRYTIELLAMTEQDAAVHGVRVVRTTAPPP